MEGSYTISGVVVNKAEKDNGTIEYKAIDISSRDKTKIYSFSRKLDEKDKFYFGQRVCVDVTVEGAILSVSHDMVLGDTLIERARSIYDAYATYVNKSYKTAEERAQTKFPKFNVPPIYAIEKAERARSIASGLQGIIYHIKETFKSDGVSLAQHKVGYTDIERCEELQRALDTKFYAETKYIVGEELYAKIINTNNRDITKDLEIRAFELDLEEKRKKTLGLTEIVDILNNKIEGFLIESVGMVQYILEECERAVEAEETRNDRKKGGHDFGILVDGGYGA